MITIRYQFKFRGGIIKNQTPNARGVLENQSDKFLLWLFNNKKETSLYEAESLGMVKRNGEIFETDIAVMKVFLGSTVQGCPPFWYNCFVVLGSTDKIIKIQSPTPEGKLKGLFFEAEGRFLRKEEYAKVLDTKGTTYKILQRTPPVAVDVIRSMITVTKIEALPEVPQPGSMMWGVRKIRRPGKDDIIA